MRKNQDFDTKDKSVRFPTDDLLRRNGYHIYQRKGNEEPLWTLGLFGKPERQSDILQRLQDCEEEEEKDRKERKSCRGR